MDLKLLNWRNRNQTIVGHQAAWMEEGLWAWNHYATADHAWAIYFCSDQDETVSFCHSTDAATKCFHKVTTIEHEPWSGSITSICQPITMLGLTQVEAVLSISWLSTISPKVNMATVAMLLTCHRPRLPSSGIMWLSHWFLYHTDSILHIINPSVTLGCTKIVPHLPLLYWWVKG